MEAKELKALLGERALEIIAKGIPIQKYNSRTRDGLCPIHSEDTPSFSWFDDGNCFKCFGCGETLDIYDYLVHYEGMSFMEAKEKVAGLVGNTSYAKTAKPKQTHAFRKVEIKNKPLSEQFYKYLKDERKIERATVDYWRVVESTINFAKKGEPEDLRRAMTFNCFDEYGENKHATYRSIDKKIKQSYETEKILWGMWHINPTKPLCIVEGQLDSMTVWQCGFKNVVSVPSGSKNYDWIEHCFDWLMKFDDIIVWIDSDLPGHQMGEEIKSRLSNSRIIKHPVYSDANAMLQATNEREVFQFVNQKPVLPDGTVYIADTQYNTDTASEYERIETGFKEIDKHINDIRRKQLSIVFGRDGEGKTTFVSQIVTHQLIKNEKTFLYSAELGQQALQDWLFRQIVGNDKAFYTLRQDKYETEYFIKPEVVKAIKRWTEDRLILIDDSKFESMKNTEKLIGIMRSLAKRQGVKLFILDNLQSIMPDTTGDTNSGQSNFVEALRTFAINDNVAVVLVAHPRKVDELDTSKGDVEFGNLGKNDVSGTKNITNKAHNVFAIERDMKAVYFDIIVTVLKDKKKGVRAGFKYKFDSRSMRYYSEDTKVEVQQPWKKYLPSTIIYHNGEEQTFENGEITRGA